MTVVARRLYPPGADLEDGVQLPPGPTVPAPDPFTFVIARVIGRGRSSVVISLRGDLAGPGVAQFRDVLQDLICDQGNLTVVVDVRELSGIDPSARAVFSAARDWAGQRGGTFQLRERLTPSSAPATPGEGPALDLAEGPR